MNDLSGFYFLLRKKQKSTFVLRITNSSSDTNLDEGSVYEGVHFVHAQARDGLYTHSGPGTTLITPKPDLRPLVHFELDAPCVPHNTSTQQEKNQLRLLSFSSTATTTSK